MGERENGHVSQNEGFRICNLYNTRDKVTKLMGNTNKSLAAPGTS